MRAVYMLIVLLTAVASLTASQAQNTPFASITYDEFMSLEPDARHEIFIQMTPAKQASLVQLHLRTWKEEHRDQLDAAQLQFINEAIALATPELYSSARRAITEAEAKARLEEASRYFSEEQIAEVFLLSGPARRR